MCTDVKLPHVHVARQLKGNRNLEMKFLPPQLADISILKRILFASTYLPKEFPEYWTVVTDFAKAGSSGNKMISPDTVKTTVENLQLLIPSADSLHKGDTNTSIFNIHTGQLRNKAHTCTIQEMSYIYVHTLHSLDCAIQ